MIALAKDIDRDDGPHEDHFVHLRGATWEDYERLLEVRGEHSVPRITYFEGTIEVMSPSHTHEALKSTIGRLVEVWCLERGVVFSTLGSWTLKSKKKKSGLEPDECYVFGKGRDAARPDLAAAGNAARPDAAIDRASKATRPDLAIEVVWTSGGMRKLDVYRRLGVAEVWYWRKGRITVHRLQGEQYCEVPQSVALPGIDLDQLVGFVDRPWTSEAICDYRAALREGQ